MAVCGGGHQNSDAARFCTTCGTPLPPPASGHVFGWPPPAGPVVPPLPPAPPVPHGWGAPVTVPPHEAKGRGGRNSALVAVVVAVVTVLVVLVGVVAIGTRAEQSTDRQVATPSVAVLDDLVLVSTGQVDNGPLYLGRLGEPLGDAPAFGRGKAHWIGSQPHPERPRSSDADPGPGIVPVPGGAVVAWNSDGGLTVAAVRLGDPDPSVLYRGEADAGVGIGPEVDGETQIQIEDNGTCLVTDGVRPAEVVAEGGSTCRFQSSGQIITSTATGDEGVRSFRLLDADGTVVADIEPTGTSAQLHGDVAVVTDDEATTTAIADARSGAQIAERGAALLEHLGTSHEGTGVLVPSKPFDEDAESRGIEYVDAAGRPQLVAEGVKVTARVLPGGIVVTGEADWTTGTVRALDPTSGETVELVSSKGIDFEVVGGGDGQVLAWDRAGHVWLGPPTGPLPRVGTIEGLSGLSQIATSSGGLGVLALALGTVAGPDKALAVWIDDDGIHALPRGWNRVALADGGPQGALVIATDFSAPDDEHVLFHVDGDSVTQLDKGAIASARFDGDDALYQWRRPGALTRETAIRRRALDARSDPSVVQARAMYALPPPGSTVWEVESGDAPWSAVTGCGAVRHIAPLSATYGPLDEPWTVCVAGQGRPGRLTIEVSSLMPFHLVIEDRTGVLATVDGPVDRTQIPIRTDGSPVTVRATPGPGEAQELYIGAAFKADP